MTDAKWYASWVRMIPAESVPEKMRNLEAADLIESLAAELEQVKRERDAMFEQIESARSCRTCKHDDFCTGNVESCETCRKRKKCPCNPSQPECNWQWRGVKEE